MRTHTPTSDRQLWRLVDAVDGHEYAWPIYATLSRETDGQCFFVELALPAETKSQWEFVSERLGPKAFDSDGTHWLIRPTVFEKIAFKCEGVTPEYYRKWGETPAVEKPVVQESLTTEIVSDSETFIRYCCAEAGITDVPTMRLMFQIFCKCGLRWLLVDRRPLSLGFATIHALPYRKEAVELLRQQWPHVLTTLKRRRLRMGILEATGFVKSLHNPDLLEVSDGNTFGWSLHVVEEKPFEKTVEKLERETLANSEPYKYVNRLGSKIKQSYEATITVLASYLSKANTSMGRVDFSGARNRPVLLPKIPHYRIRKARKEGVVNDAADNSVAPATQPTGENQTYASPPPQMPPVSNEK